MSNGIFRNITRYTNSSKHLITIELQIDEYNLQKVCPLKSETFYLTDATTCFLKLSVTPRRIPLSYIHLTLVGVKDSERFIKGLTALGFDGNGSRIHWSLLPRDKKIPKDFNLLYDFAENYTSIEVPIKFVFYLETQNAVGAVKLKTGGYDSEISCFRELSLDLMKLYDQHIGADVTVRVGGVDIEAHKSILRARSSVFNEMFELSTSECADNFIDIKEFSAPIIKEFLAFLYTGIKKKHDFDTAKELYHVAVKYEVLSFRDACKMGLLSHHLREENACQILILADQHGDESFKNSIMAFMNANLKSIIKTEQFEILNENYPKLTLKLMRNSFFENC